MTVLCCSDVGFFWAVLLSSLDGMHFSAVWPQAVHKDEPEQPTQTLITVLFHSGVWKEVIQMPELLCFHFSRPNAANLMCESPHQCIAHLMG